uniref:Uncharacterized protein LOC117351761 n=1 Tax=Geotrypetes seraphini TaxID=260995 RepID=A0A6P8Q8C9_GEOSA|nr:uncharacterized protein LOC117351761 [Geotrypetes seraphini]
MFDNELYVQTSGVAMGAAFAPSIANLYMTNFEKELIKHSAFADKILCWYRFIDDIFMLWGGTLIELNSFHTWLGTCDQYIQFTMQSSMDNIQFLDVDISLDVHNNFSTKVFIKLTDRNTFLKFDSSHSRKLKESLPFSQMVRIRRNCSSLTDYSAQSKDLSSKLELRGYPRRTLNRAQKRVKYLNCDHLLHQLKGIPPGDHEEDQETFETFVTRYCSKSKVAVDIIKRNWEIVNLHPCFENSKLRIAFSRNQNLKEILSPSFISCKLPKYPSKDIVLGHYKCGSCNICSITKECKEFFNPQDQKKYVLRHFTNCKSTFVVYLIICPCDKFYVGMTSRDLRTRMREHKSNLKLGRCSEVIVEH